MSAAPTTVVVPALEAPMVEWALFTASLGLRVHPLFGVREDGSCACGGPDHEDGKGIGKHPILKGWQAQATTDPSVIATWWRSHVNANVGVSTDGLTVLDEDGEEGRASGVALQHEHGAFPHTLTVQTGSGGMHRYFRSTPESRLACSVKKIAAGVDIRAEGGNLVGPGSRHKSGRRYEIATLAPLAPLPAWVPSKIRAAEQAKEIARAAKVAPRTPTLRMAGAADHEQRGRAYARTMDPAISGSGGHSTAMRCATAIVRGFNLGEDVALRVLSDEWNPTCSPPWSDAELRHKVREATAKGDKEWGYLLDATRERDRAPIVAGSVAATATVAPIAAGVLTDHAHVIDARWFATAPKPRAWLLCDRRRAGAGVLPLGKSGMLLGAGGLGKTGLAVDLALAVASGGEWLETFPVASPGRVFLALGEEDAEEAHRRIYSRARGMQAPPADGSIIVASLAGVPCALLERADNYSPLRPSAFAAELAEYVAARGPFALVILDPLSRFAGPDCEKDNASATAYVQQCEHLASLTGATVLTAHHTSQAARTSRGPMGAEASRGVTALTDGARWVASIAPIVTDAPIDDDLQETITFAVVKSNYSAKGSPLALKRTADGGLVPLDAVERDMVSKALDTRATKRARRDEQGKVHVAEMASVVLTVLRDSREGLTFRGLRGAVHAALGTCGDGALHAALAHLGKAVEVLPGPRNAAIHQLARSDE